jgi:hypothetical protein
MDRPDRGKGNIVQLFDTLVFLSKIIIGGCRVMREEQRENTRRARHEQADEKVRNQKGKDRAMPQNHYGRVAR